MRMEKLKKELKVNEVVLKEIEKINLNDFQSMDGKKITKRIATKLNSYLNNDIVRIVYNKDAYLGTSIEIIIKENGIAIYTKLNFKTENLELNILKEFIENIKEGIKNTIGYLNDTIKNYEVYKKEALELEKRIKEFKNKVPYKVLEKLKNEYILYDLK
jgi:hypothetical protein